MLIVTFRREIYKMNEDNNQSPVNTPQEPETNTTLAGLDPAEHEQMTQFSTPVVSHHHKSRKWLVVLLGILLVVSGIAVALWYQNNQANKSNTARTVTSSQNKVRPSAAPTDIDALLIKISGSITGTKIEEKINAPDFKVEGFEFAAAGTPLYSKSLSYVITTGTAVVAAKNTEQLLFAEGFKKSSQQVPVDRNTTNLTKYENNDTVCGTTYTGTTIIDGKENKRGSITVACAYKDTYKATATRQKPFYEAYRVVERDDRNNVGNPRILESRTDGYKFAEVAVYPEASPGGAVGLFYMTPDKIWRFFVATQQVVECSQYKTLDQKKAFMGEPCYLGSGDELSVVRL
jgi:hypothetical protein